MQKRIRIWDVICLGLAAFIALPIGAAGAASADGNCERELCFYKDAGFRGCMRDAEDDGSSGNLDGDYRTCKGQKMKDSISSYQNRTSSWTVLWEHPDFKGFVYCIAPGASGDVIPTFNDKASSAGTGDRAAFDTQLGEAKCNHIDRD